MVKEHLKSILFAGMLFLCPSLFPHAFPDELFDYDGNKYISLFIESRVPFERGIDLPSSRPFTYISLVPDDDLDKFLYEGYLFRDEVWVTDQCEKFFYDKEFKFHFYFYRTKRMTKLKKTNSTGTVYNNEDELDEELPEWWNEEPEKDDSTPLIDFSDDY